MSTKKSIARQPPSGAPEGTVWFGGPVDLFKITLRIMGDDVDPDHLTALLGCTPTKAERKGIAVSTPGGTRIPRTGHWAVTTESSDPDEDVGDGVRSLLARLPSDPALWASLTSKYAVDLFCGIFMKSSNRGFGISPDVSTLLSERRLEIGFDLYFDPPK